MQLFDESPKEIYLALDKIKDKLKDVKTNNIKRIIKIVLVLISILLLFYIFLNFGVSKINYYSNSKEKEAFIRKINNSNYIFSTGEIKEISNKFVNDQDFTGKLSNIQYNNQNSVYARLNSNILIGAILPNYKISSRNQINNINWNNSSFVNNQMVGKVFLKGEINNVIFENSGLSNIYFNETELSDLSFNECFFSDVHFLPKEGSVLRFTGCKFFSSYIELTNFFNVHFMTVASNDPSIIDASKSTYFENCIFKSNFQKKSLNTIDFTESKAVKFEKINFSNCIFNGVLDKDWFSNCGFMNVLLLILVLLMI